MNAELLSQTYRFWSDTGVILRTEGQVLDWRRASFRCHLRDCGVLGLTSRGDRASATALSVQHSILGLEGYWCISQSTSRRTSPKMTTADGCISAWICTPARGQLWRSQHKPSIMYLLRLHRNTGPAGLVIRPQDMSSAHASRARG